MKITVYKAKLHTAGKTPEQILKSFNFGPKPSDEVVKGIIKAYDLADGMEVYVTDSFDNGYSLLSYRKSDESKFKEIIYAFEQDPFVGTYVGEREQFNKDWDAGEYEAPGSLSLDKEDVEIIEKLS